MDSKTRKTLEAEWKNEIATNLATQIKLENEVKAEFIAALKEKQAAIKEERAASSPKTSVVEKLGKLMNLPGSYGVPTEAMARLDSQAYIVRSAIKNATREMNPKLLPGIHENNKTTSDIINLRQQDAITVVKNGTLTKDGEAAFEKWVKAHESDEGRKLIAEKQSALTPDVLETLAQQRKQLAKESVEQIIQTNNFIADGSQKILNNIEVSQMAIRQAELAPTTARLAEELATRAVEQDVAKAQLAKEQNSENEAIKERLAAIKAEEARPQAVIVDAAEVTATVSIEARSEIYKDISAEVGPSAAAALVTREVTQDWSAADAKDLETITNADLKASAVEIVADNAASVPQYKEALVESQPELATAVADSPYINNEALAAEEKREAIPEDSQDAEAAPIEAGITAEQLEATDAAIEAEQQREAIPEDRNNEPGYVADPDTQFESISPSDAAKEDRKAADMDKITDADLAAYDALEAADAEHDADSSDRTAIDSEIAINDLNNEPAAEVVPEDRHKDTASMTEAERLEAADAEHDANSSDRTARDSEAADLNNEAATEIIPEDWNNEVEADPFGAPIEAEQQTEIIPEDWNKEAEADPFGAPIEAEQQAEIIPEDWNKEAEADPFGAPIEAEQQAEIIPEDWNNDIDQEALNTIEPVTERTVDAPKTEQVVIDQQTLDNLAKVRATDRQAVEEQLGHDLEKAGLADKPLKANQVESDEIFTARKETVKPVLPPDVEREYVNVGNKYYSQKNPETVAFEDKGNKLETRSNDEKVASNLVKIAEARGWDEIKVSGSETFRREVWVEAAARGIHVKGYTPNDQDKTNLAKRMVNIEANKIETLKTREKQSEKNATNPDLKKRDAPQIARAASFKNDSPETALKKHPELAGAYAAQAAMQKKMETDRIPLQQQAVVRARIRENLVNSIERGQLPEVKRREEVTKNREVSEEREMGR